MQIIWAMNHTQPEALSVWRWQVLANKALKREKILARKRCCSLSPLPCSWQWADMEISKEAHLKSHQGNRRRKQARTERGRLSVLFSLIPSFPHQHTHPLRLTLNRCSVMLNRQSKQAKQSHENKKASRGWGRCLRSSDKRTGNPIPTVHITVGGHGNLPAIPALGGGSRIPEQAG